VPVSSMNSYSVHDLCGKQISTDKLLTYLLKTREVASLLGVHGRSGMERGLGEKDLASAYVLRPLDWQVLIFQG
jgi:hypothetical protein